MVKQKIILASTSPRRKGLLQQMGIDFKIIPSDYEEDMAMKLSAKELAKVLAYGKAKDVADKIKEGIVIGVDTFLVYKGKKLGKPHTKANALRMLRMFSGKEIRVYSGVALINAKTGKEIRDYEVSKFTFKKLSDREIKNYIKTGEPLDKAGAIAIQGLGSIFIRSIKGCYANIVGFPIYNIAKNLEKMGVAIFNHGGWRGK
ncbi:septum formation inhibitor Maf [archaeon]|jgi:septum formation protein|nr:septum formation inhibitor Maf [archaeon]MBT4373263.1 septum formation inhibitor Maf [archaeon]MBT4531608.1 septum formation inhibitor Maf [archaeon]MBT7001214.1 septum formation inhibitor Maf [archaeon]MBT7282300.1 septum formation inhibitor Maf [archaeon]